MYTGMARPTETTGDSIPWSSSPIGACPIPGNRGVGCLFDENSRKGNSRALYRGSGSVSRR